MALCALSVRRLRLLTTTQVVTLSHGAKPFFALAKRKANALLFELVGDVCLAVRALNSVCALHDVFPRDLWLCVLPGWQMNVNVNVNVRALKRTNEALLFERALALCGLDTRHRLDNGVASLQDEL